MPFMDGHYVLGMSAMMPFKAIAFIGEMYSLTIRSCIVYVENHLLHFAASVN